MDKEAEGKVAEQLCAEDRGQFIAFEAMNYNMQEYYLLRARLAIQTLEKLGYHKPIEKPPFSAGCVDE